MKRPVVMIVGAAAGALLVAGVGASAHTAINLATSVGTRSHLFGDEATAARVQSPEPEASPEATPTAEPAERPEPAATAEPAENEPAENENDNDNDDNDAVEHAGSGNHDDGGDNGGGGGGGDD